VKKCAYAQNMLTQNVENCELYLKTNSTHFLSIFELILPCLREESCDIQCKRAKAQRDGVKVWIAAYCTPNKGPKRCQGVAGI